MFVFMCVYVFVCVCGVCVCGVVWCVCVLKQNNENRLYASTASFVTPIYIWDRLEVKEHRSVMCVMGVC